MKYLTTILILIALITISLLIRGPETIFNYFCLASIQIPAIYLINKINPYKLTDIITTVLFLISIAHIFMVPMLLLTMINNYALTLIISDIINYAYPISLGALYLAQVVILVMHSYRIFINRFDTIRTGVGVSEIH